MTMSQNSRHRVKFLDSTLEILVILSSLNFKNFPCNFGFSYTHTRLHKIAQKSCVITHTCVSASEPCLLGPLEPLRGPLWKIFAVRAVLNLAENGKI